jgi:ribosomal protein L40E
MASPDPGLRNQASVRSLLRIGGWIAIGSWMLKAGYIGPASRYIAGEVTPTVRDTLGALGVGSRQLICGSCGGANAPDARFCDDCGTPPAWMCASCGADNAGDATFCRSCGADLATAP